MTVQWTIPAFSAYGIELEYAIVDASTLDVRPLARELLRYVGDANSRTPDLDWSNELVAHVVECKNVVPMPDLEQLAKDFHHAIQMANRTLDTIDARLMPAGMHPWMDPRHETMLWTHSQADIYETYDRIFDCRRHGWANLQSMHINLPFANDSEFARLHAAVRLVVPLLPALSASSPIVGGAAAGMVDGRLEAYRTNARGLTTIVGEVVPEAVTSRREYETRILEPMYREIAPFDPEGVLRHEWLNSRGAIARFDRSAIEIRVVDTQECPKADVSIAAAAIAAIKSLYHERWSTWPQQHEVATAPLAQILSDTMRVADEAMVEDSRVLAALGMSSRCSVNDFWRRVLDDADGNDADDGGWWRAQVAFILDRGCLARRILRAVAGDFSRDHLRTVYAQLCACLRSGQPFVSAE